jgi:hypothetical protein
MKLYFFFAIPLLLAAYFLYEEEEVLLEKQKGVCWVGMPDTIASEDVARLKASGITWISQTPFGWQQNPSDTVLRFEKNTNRTPWWGESFVGIATTTRLAKQEGIQTILKPHLWLRQSWPGEVEMKSEKEWQAWFRAYEEFILSYAHVADTTGIEILCIGTELQKTIHRSEWVSLIKKIRGIYKGKLTYAANFNEFEKVPFWNELDFIGIQAYFPLTKDEHPTVGKLELGWQEPLETIDALQRKIKKPILFTEVGYKSTADAAIEPWLWPSREKGITVSEQTQANAYHAFFNVMWEKEWMAGVYFWKWYPKTPKRSVEHDFTPQGKEAEKIMTEWFSTK